MKLTREQVEKIAHLARIELAESDIEKFQNQLSQVLNYIESLQEVDTSTIEETAQVTNLENVWRQDSMIDCPADERQAALEEAPDFVANMIKVKSVF